LISGEPYSGFFADRGILVRPNGPVLTDERASEAPSLVGAIRSRRFQS
jgi:hypothetical protein